MTIKWKPSDVDAAYLRARAAKPGGGAGTRQGLLDFIRGRRNGGQGNGQGNGQGAPLTPRPPQ